MKLSKRLLSKTVAIAAICATMATAAFAAPKVLSIPLKFKLRAKHLVL